MTAARDGATILVADDDPVIRGNLRMLLETEGYHVLEAGDGLKVEKLLGDPGLALVLLDLRMPGRGGMDVLREHAEIWEDIPVIVITALGGSSAAIEAMKLGAFDYITKPFDLDEVIFTVRRALAQKALVAQVRALSDAEQEGTMSHDGGLGGRSAAMVQVFKTIGKVAAASESILIMGESGTGKELVAAAI